MLLGKIACENVGMWTEHDKISSKFVSTQRSAFAVEASGNPGDGGNPVEASSVTFTQKKKKNRASNMPTKTNLHLFVTDVLTKCLKLLISLDCVNIIRAQPIQSIQTQQQIGLQQLLQGTSTLLVKPSSQQISSIPCINENQHPSTCINRIACTQALLAESASALDTALPGHCIPLGVDVSFGKGLS